MSALEESPLPKYLQVQNLNDECRELLQSLPSEKGWLSTYLHLYQGFWYGTRQMIGALSTQRNFQALDSDILLVTTPKSGTTWFKALLFALLNRSEPNRTSDSGHPLLQKNPHDLVPSLEILLYSEDPDPDLSSFTSPRLFATHMPLVSLPKSVVDSKCKLVYLCRNPKDTFISMWHFINELRLEEMGKNSLEEAFEKFCRGVYSYGPYWDHVLGYYKASLELPHKVLFLKYEEMKENPREQLRRLAKFLGCPFSEEDEGACGGVDEILRLCSFDNLRRLEVNRSGKILSGEDSKIFFRKGEVGDWANYLTPEMAERLDRITEEKLRGSGLKF